MDTDQNGRRSDGSVFVYTKELMIALRKAPGRLHMDIPREILRSRSKKQATREEVEVQTPCAQHRYGECKLACEQDGRT